MALAAATLKTGLAAMAPTMSEATAINNFVSAWNTYFSAASAGGVVPVTPGSLTPALGLMQTALSGMSASGAGAAKIQAGILAFWGGVASAAAAIWPTATTINPPTGPAGVTGLASALTSVFSANQSGNLSLNDAAQAIATAIHGTQSGCMAVFPPLPGGLGPLPIA